MMKGEYADSLADDTRQMLLISVTHDANSTKSTFTHTTVLRPFFQDHSGEPEPEENFWTL